MTGLSNLLRSRKAVLSLLAMLCLTLLAALGRLDGEMVMGAIVFLATGYGVAQAWEDRVGRGRVAHAIVQRSGDTIDFAAIPGMPRRKKRPPPPVAMGLLLSLLSGGLPLTTGCGGSAPPGCSAEDNAMRIAAIDREYLGRLLDECLPYGERSKCPHAKRLESERDAKVKAYEQECTR